MNEFLDEAANDIRKDEYVTQMLIDCFQLFGDGYKKCSLVADSLITIFGGNVLAFRLGRNPILEACSIGRFQCLHYVIQNKLITRWDKLIDSSGKNIFHYASEHNEYQVVREIVMHIIKNKISKD